MAVAGQQQPRSLTKQITRTININYLLYLPASYDADPVKRWPLLLFLHGAGERGSDLGLVKKHGIAKVVEQRPDYPFIAVSPQCPVNEWWTAEPLALLLDEIEAGYRVDPRRIYVTGLSMGGYGTWTLAAANPERFAAIAPICGGGMPINVRRLAHPPAWVFHGARDPVVPLRQSEEMVDALKARGGEVRLTVYPEAEHDSWTETYNNPELYDWLLSHQRKA